MAFKTKAEKAFDEKLSEAIDRHDWNEVERLFNKLACVYELIYGEDEAGYCVAVNLKSDRVLNYIDDDDDLIEQADARPEHVQTARDLVLDILTIDNPKPFKFATMDEPEPTPEQAKDIDGLLQAFDLLDGKCVYLKVWVPEAGVEMDICQNHMNNSRHEENEGPNRPCLTVDPYPLSIEENFEFAKIDSKVDRKCGVCGHDPARGLASITTDGKETYYCHGDEQDDPTCYQIAQLGKPKLDADDPNDPIPF